MPDVIAEATARMFADRDEIDRCAKYFWTVVDSLDGLERLAGSLAHDMGKVGLKTRSREMEEFVARLRYAREALKQ